MPATIGPGSTGDDVKRLQRVLARMLLWNPFGPITGTFDITLETSVKDFQQSNGLPADGIVGPTTWAKLPSYREASPTLQSGSRGPAVAWLQQGLSGADIAIQFPPYAGAIDGVDGATHRTTAHKPATATPAISRRRQAATSNIAQLLSMPAFSVFTSWRSMLM